MFRPVSYSLQALLFHPETLVFFRKRGTHGTKRTFGPGGQPAPRWVVNIHCMHLGKIFFVARIMYRTLVVFAERFLA